MLADDASADTSQNEQMRNVPSLPDSPSSVSSVRYRSTKPFSVRSSAIASTVLRIRSSVPGRNPNMRGEQRRGVQGIGLVVLAQHAPVAHAVREDVGLDLVGASRPRRRELGVVADRRRAWRRGPARPSPSASRTRSAAARRGPPRCPGPARATTAVAHSACAWTSGHSRRAGAGCAGCAAAPSPARRRTRRSAAGRTRRCRCAPASRPRSR